MRLLFCLVLSIASCTKTVRSVPVTPERTPCGKPVIIAVIDTGYGKTPFGTTPNAKLCKYGHADFTYDQDTTKEFGTVEPVPVDKEGHGTHIVGIIDKAAREANINYCIVVLKYYEKHAIFNENLQNTVKAIKFATYLHVDFINYSGGGQQKSEEEAEAVKAFIDQGGTFVAAAGNEKSDLAVKPYYPAMDDDRVIVVGNGIDENHYAKTSNYGERVDFWEKGINVKSYDMYMSGTSQATAIHTGKMVAASHNICK